MSSTRNIHQPGLKWESNMFGIKPTWTTEPSVAIIKKIAQQSLGCSCDIESLAQGAFNKVYIVKCSSKDFVFRVALPVAPKVKTLSEVATIRFIRSKTSIPVPQIIAYDADLKNELGFEWIIMERVNGRSLRERWNEVSWLKKGILVQKMAKFLSELSQLEHDGIGSLYDHHLESHTNESVSTTEPVTGELVMPMFFVGDHIQQNLHRGPYETSTDYVLAFTKFLLQDIQTWRKSEDEDDQEQAEEAQVIYDKLQLVILKIFSDTKHEPTIILHHDLSENNILVDDAGDLVGIIDWECVIAAPRWQAYRIPQFIGYGKDEDIVPEPLTEGQQNDEDAVEDYNDSLHDYEATQLNRFFFEEMKRLEPEWVKLHNESTIRREIMLAVESVSNGVCSNRIELWLDCLLEGKQPQITLTESLFDPFKYDN